MRNKTTSLWSYINANRGEFTNYAYVEHDGVVELSTSLCSLQLWTNYYFQYKDTVDDSGNEATMAASQLVNHAPSALNSNNPNSYMVTPTVQSVNILL